MAGLTQACAARVAPPVVDPGSLEDHPLPGSAGGGASLRAVAGRRPREFHVTFEQDGRGVYTAFDGATWRAPVAITEGPPFRSGVHLAVARSGEVHFVWGTGRTGACLHRSLRGGRLGPIAPVEPTTAWGECDVAVDIDDAPLVAVTRVTEGLAVYRRAKDGWTFTEFPRQDTSAARWSPTLAVTPGGRVYVAARLKPGDHPTIWHVREAGVWSDEHLIPGNKKEPFGIVVGETFLIAALGAPTFMRIEPGRDLVATAVELRARFVRGQHVGLAATSRGTLFATYSDQNGENAEDRTLHAGQRYLHARSRDGGRTWEKDLPLTSSDQGQGYGTVAAHGDDVLFVWPDRRNGGQIRFTLRRDR
jgi:hypothetical protein